MRREYPSRKTSSVEGGVGLPVTALPVDVTVGTGLILEEDEAIKAGLVGPFPISDEGDSRIWVSNGGGYSKSERWGVWRWGHLWGQEGRK